MRLLITVLLALAVVAGQLLYGGTRQAVFGMPAYFLTAVAGVLALAGAFWKRAIPPRSGVVAAGLVAGLYLIVRAWESPGQDLALFYTLLISGSLVAFLAMAVVVTTPAARYTWLVMLLLAGVLQATVAAVQFSSDTPVWPLPWFSEQMRLWRGSGFGLQRGHGLYLTGNHLAWFLNIAGFLALGVTCLGRCRLWAKILIGYGAAACFAGTVITLSRGGMVGLLAGFAAFFFLALAVLAVGARDRRGLVFLILLLASALAVGGGYLVFSKSRTVQARMEGISKDAYRESLWPAALRQAQIEPLTGTGAGSFTRLSRMLRDYPSATDDTFAHNDWAQMLADFGFVGLVLVLAVWLAALWAGWSSFLTALRDRMQVSSRAQSNSAAFLMGALCAAVACGVHAFFDFNMQIPANALVAAMVVGLLANPGIVTQKKSGGAAIRTVAACACALCGVGLAILLMRAWPLESGLLQAENAMILQDYSRAAQTARRLSESGYESARLRRIWGESLLRGAGSSGQAQRDRLAASSQLGRSAEIDPGERWTWLLLGITTSGLGQGQEAEKYYLEAIRLDPGSPAPREYYALHLENLGLSREAIRAYEASLQVPTTAFAFKRLNALRARQRP